MNKLNILLLFLLFFIGEVHAQEISYLKSTEVNVLLKENSFQNFVLIDARDSVMFQSGHIKNALNFDAFQDNISFLLKNVLEYDVLIVYCSNQRRSERIIEVLKELAYKGKIIYMIDGLTGWKSNKLETIVKE
ncbi:MAG: rhodanese-like domain-containing protein [Paludibacteraceae bacterium]|nr:rhodanese-like domain-containing protein [Paludibacteraceae bacterium]